MIELLGLVGWLAWLGESVCRLVCLAWLAGFLVCLVGFVVVVVDDVVVVF